MKDFFCKYFLNKSSDVHKILCGVNHYIESLSFKFHDNQCTNVRAQVVNARTSDKTCARAFTARARLFMRKSL